MPFRCDWRSVDRNIGGMQTALISTCVLTIPAFVAMMGKIAAVVIAIGFLVESF